MKSRWRARYSVGLTISLLMFVFLCAALAHRIFYTVDTGQAAVLYRFFWGTDTTHVYGEGIQIVFPWNRLYIYDVREQELTQEESVLSFNGLTIDVTFSFRYHPDIETLPLLHQRLGPDYVNKVVKPILIASIREVIGHYRPEELYTTHSATIQDEIREVCQRDIERNHIYFDQILVKDIDLPEKVRTAIEDKLVLEQQAEGYDFRLISEDRERLRKKIEAEGIRQFHRTVSEDLNGPLLQYLNIDVMKALVASDNSKVIVLGGETSDNVNLPIFMDDLGTRRPAERRTGAPLRTEASSKVEETELPDTDSGDPQVLQASETAPSGPAGRSEPGTESTPTRKESRERASGSTDGSTGSTTGRSKGATSGFSSGAASVKPDDAATRGGAPGSPTGTSRPLRRDGATGGPSSVPNSRKQSGRSDWSQSPDREPAGENVKAKDAEEKGRARPPPGAVKDGYEDA